MANTRTPTTQKGALLGYIRGRKTPATVAQLGTAMTKAGFPNMNSMGRRLRELTAAGQIVKTANRSGSVAYGN